MWTPLYVGIYIYVALALMLSVGLHIVRKQVVKQHRQVARQMVQVGKEIAQSRRKFRNISQMARWIGTILCWIGDTLRWVVINYTESKVLRFIEPRFKTIPSFWKAFSRTLIREVFLRLR